MGTARVYEGWIKRSVALAAVFTFAAGCTNASTAASETSISTAVTPTPTPSTSAAPSPTARPAVPPKPGGPLGGYLLIADRGTDRMLLVDSAKHILWRYPHQGTTPSMPFAFDDDTFFTPDRSAIISNQEDQETIQVISFPEGKVVWHYGHVNVSGSSPGYLDTPDDA